MKIKDLKESQLKEYNWSELFKGVNNYGSAQMAKPKGATTTGYLSQQIYIDDFVSKLSQSLTNAIATGQIDLNAISGGQAPQQPATTVPATNATTAQPATTAPATNATTAQPATSPFAEPVQQTQAGQKLASKRAAAQKKVQRKVDKVSKAQYKKPPEPTQQEKDADWERQASGTNESKYHALNNLFEAIIREQAGTETLQDYVFDLLAKQYPAVGTDKKKPYISAQIEELRKAILADKGQVGRNALNAIKKFGQAWYAISQTSAAAKAQPAQSGQAAQTATTAQASQTTAAPAQAAQTTAPEQPAQTTAAAPTKLKIKDIKSAVLGMKTRQKQDLVNFIQKNMSDLGKTEKPAAEPEAPMQEPKVAAAGGGGTAAQPTRKPNLRIVPK